jgi:UDP-GlcNAc:undecaprenyl-phosphate/decaprenyl-phosphate GlcNAc-1-phosphate transferase
MVDAFVVFGVALGVVLVATPFVRRLAFRVGAVDEPEERRIHQRVTPRLGGVAIFGGVAAALGVGALLPGFREVFTETSEPQAVLAASLVILVLGLADDLRGVSAPVKLAGQVMAGGTLALLGVSMTLVYVPPDTVVALGNDLGALFTVAAIVAMINAVNLVDGLDGLAAGIVAIAALALFTYVQLAEATTVGLASSSALLLAAVAGACLGFLVYNFNPASIFMGDTGAMLLGLLLGAAGISAIGGTVQPSRGAFAAFSLPVAVPALVLAVPFADTVWTILRRLRSGRAVFSPDKMHLHHRLLEIGHSQRRAVLVMYYWSAVLAFAAVGVSLLRLPVLVGLVACAVGAAAAFAAVSRLPLGRPRGRHAAQRRFVSSFTKTGGATGKGASDQEKQRQRQL